MERVLLTSRRAKSGRPSSGIGVNGTLTKVGFFLACPLILPRKSYRLSRKTRMIVALLEFEGSAVDSPLY